MYEPIYDLDRESTNSVHLKPMRARASSMDGMYFKFKIIVAQNINCCMVIIFIYFADKLCNP